MAATLGQLNPLRYRGYVYDQETGLYYLQSRYYNPEIGRFISSDVVYDYDAGLQGFNLFAYCGNNPVNRIDISGTDSVPVDDTTENILEAKTLGGSSTYGSTRTAYSVATNPMDTGYRYSVDLRQAGNSSSFTGGILSNGYTSYGTVTNPDSASPTSQANNPLTGIQYTNKVREQMRLGDTHGFPLLVDNYGALGTLTTEQGGDGRMYQHLRIPGAYLGHGGYFHYIWDGLGVCNHRQFVIRE